jgi:aldehyde dehydrogenase (NAD+)
VTDLLPAVPDLITPTWEYAPAPEARDLVTIDPSYGLFIGGEMVDPAEGGSHTTFDPATGLALAEVATASATDVDRAVAAARKAQPGWAALPGRERAKYLYRLARLVQDRARELAVLESIDNGKPIREARDVDVPLVAAHLFHHAGTPGSGRAHSRLASSGRSSHGTSRC